MTFLKTLRLLFILCVASYAFAQTHDASKIFELHSEQTTQDLKINFNIQDKHFLYQQRIHIESTDPKNVLLGNMVWPAPLMQQDKLGHTHPIYRQSLNLRIPLQIRHFTPDQQIRIEYQGCSDAGICYPPVTEYIALHDAKPQAFLWILLSFMGLGVLLSFTPCVLPMLPIMTRIVIGESHSKGQTWGLSMAYILGMSSSYALVGAIVAHLGKNLFMLAQQPVVLMSMAIIYILFGLATLGVWEIQLPQFIQKTTLNYRHQLSSGKYFSAFVMGAISLLVLSPCVTAPLLGALAYITQLGEVLKGSLALFALGLGMGIPLLVFAVSAGHFLPRVGPWMENIKKVLALLLFAVASLLIQRLLNAPWQMFPWIVTVAIALLLFIPHRPHLVAKTSIFILMLLSAGLFFYHQMEADGAHPSLQNIQQIQKRLSQSHKPILMYFSAKWCTTCHYIETNIISKEKLKDLCRTMDLIRIDISDNTKEQMQIIQTFKIIAPPTMIVWDPKTNTLLYQASGEEITPQQLKKMCHFFH